MRRFSVLLVCQSYPPVLGGSEIEAQRVCAALRRRGHDVAVVCAGGPPMPAVSEWVDPEGVPVRIFGSGRFKDYAFAVGVVRTLWRERRRFQIVYFLMQGIHLAAGLPVARWLHIPILMKVSGSGIITQMRASWLGRLELRWLGQWAHRVMILNPGMVAEAEAAGLGRDRLLWMPNPVDLESFAPCDGARRAELRALLRIPAAAPVVVFVGRLAPEKELPSLIDAFARVVRASPEARLVLVGDGPIRSALEAQAGKLGLAGSVRFTGRQTMEQVREWLQAGDVFALVSSNEGFPCSLVEAMATGLASVVSDIPANAQLVEDGVQGLRAKVGDTASIADALLRLLQDEPQRARMGSAARLEAAGFSTDKVLDRYEALFGEALNAPM